MNSYQKGQVIYVGCQSSSSNFYTSMNFYPHIYYSKSNPHLRLPFFLYQNILFKSLMHHFFSTDVIEIAAKSAGIQLGGSLPAGVEVSVRQGDGYSLIFIMNYTNGQQVFPSSPRSSSPLLPSPSPLPPLSLPSPLLTFYNRL